MKRHAGFRYAFNYTPEAWHYNLNLTDRNTIPAIIISHAVDRESEEDGDPEAEYWEFAIEERRHYDGDTYLALDMMSEAWRAFGDVPELFEQLRSGQLATLAA